MNSANKSIEVQANASKAKFAFENLKTDFFLERIFSCMKKKISPNN